MKRHNKKSLVLVLSITLLLFWAPPVPASDDARIVVDSLLVRPIGVCATLTGSVIFVFSLPFSAATGSIGKVAEELVMAPGRYTFKRPMGEFKKRALEDHMRGWAVTQDPSSRILKETE